MPEWLIKFINRGGAVMVFLISGIVWYYAGWAWGVFAFCALIALLWSIALFIVPVPFPWNRDGGWKIFVGAVAFAIIFAILGVLTHS